MFDQPNPHLEDFILKTFEQYLGFYFPKEYREFLKKHNGGRPKKRMVFDFKDKDPYGGSVLSVFFGFVPDEYENILLSLKMYQDRIPWNTFPVADDTFGNLVLLSVKGPDRGKIYFWDHELEVNTDHGETPDYSNLTLVADSFDEFIQNLKSENVLEV
ncbi:MAG: SMI1/KNR4 family protein [Alphaproteobacteria bacterium]